MATIDPVRNNARVIVANPYNDVATSIALMTGNGAKLPDPVAEGPYNMFWWNVTDYPDPADDPEYEIVRVMANVNDVLTVTRAQEGTTAGLHNIAGKTYYLALGITKKMIDDLRGAYPTVVKAVLNGTLGYIDVAIAGIDANTKLIPAWGINMNMPIGSLFIASQGLNTVRIQSTADEATVDKNIIITIFP